MKKSIFLSHGSLLLALLVLSVDGVSGFRVNHSRGSKVVKIVAGRLVDGSERHRHHFNADLLLRMLILWEKELFSARGRGHHGRSSV